MFRLIYRQRRRLLFSAFFTTLALMMMAFQFVGPAFGNDEMPLWIVLSTLAIVTTVVMVLTLLVGTLFLLVLPNWRCVLELIAFFLFVCAVLEQFVPSVFEIPYVGPFLPFFVWIALFSATYGDLLDRFRLWVDHNQTRRFFSPHDAETLWRELVPGEAPVEGHWDPLLHDLEQDPEEPDTCHVKYTLGGSVYELQTMTFLVREQPTHARYHHVGEVDPRNRSLVEGTYDIRITPRADGTGCDVTLTASRTCMLPRIGLQEWFDDQLGDRADSLRARHRNLRDWSISAHIRRKIMKLA